MIRTVTRRTLFAIAGLALASGAIVASPIASAQPASTWKAIHDRGSLRIGATQAEPWYFKNPQTKKWSGFCVTLAQKMADTMGVKLDIVETTWGNAIAALQADKIDEMCMLDATPKRALAVDFPTAPLMYYALAILARDDLKVENWEDLNKPGITISLTMGTTIDAYITPRVPKATVLRFPTNDEVVAAFQSGRADAASLFHPPLILLRKKVGRGQLILPKPIRPSASSVAVRREPDKTWRDWVSTSIAYYYNTNQTQQWYEDFLSSRGIDPKSVPAIVKELW